MKFINLSGLRHPKFDTNIEIFEHKKIGSMAYNHKPQSPDLQIR